MQSADVLVLGGGPAGLACAWWAARTGRSVGLLERATSVGGLAASFDLAGVRADHGSHRLHPATSPRILGELRSLLGDDLQHRPRHGRIQVAGRWVTFPPSPVQLARALPVGLAARLAADMVRAPLRRSHTDTADTYGAVVRATVGSTLGEVVYFPMAHKLWDTAPTALAGEQARRRISASSPAAVARRMFRRSKPYFFYPRRGFGQIPEALADAALAAGANVTTSIDVTSIDLTNRDCARVVGADGSVFEAPVLLSTIPLARLVRLVDPAASAPVAAAADRSKTRAMVLVLLVVAERQWTPFDAHYLPSRGVLPTRISEPKNYRDGDDPPDRTVLCAEIPCWPGDAIWNASDADLGARVVDDITRAGLPAVTPSPLGGCGAEVRRLPSVYPVYRTGFESDMTAIEQWLDGFPALVTLGRQGLFAHDNTHHTLEMAHEAVDALLPNGMIDRARWTAARERFRTHVVED